MKYKWIMAMRNDDFWSIVYLQNITNLEWFDYLHTRSVHNDTTGKEALNELNIGRRLRSWFAAFGWKVLKRWPCNQVAMNRWQNNSFSLARRRGEWDYSSTIDENLWAPSENIFKNPMQNALMYFVSGSSELIIRENSREMSRESRARRRLIRSYKDSCRLSVNSWMKNNW